VKVGPAKVGHVKVGPAKVGPAKVGPVKVGPVKVGPVKVGPAQVLRDGAHAFTACTGRPQEPYGEDLLATVTEPSGQCSMRT
jgi:hypothetical protein